MVASTSTSCVVTAGNSKDGFMYRMDDNMAASTYSLNKLHPDRSSVAARSLGSTHSIPLYLMPRPNSVAGKCQIYVCCSRTVSGSCDNGSRKLTKDASTDSDVPELFL